MANSINPFVWAPRSAPRTDIRKRGSRGDQLFKWTFFRTISTLSLCYTVTTLRTTCPVLTCCPRNTWRCAISVSRQTVRNVGKVTRRMQQLTILPRIWRVQTTCQAVNEFTSDQLSVLSLQFCKRQSPLYDSICELTRQLEIKVGQPWKVYQ